MGGDRVIRRAAAKDMDSIVRFVGSAYESYALSSGWEPLEEMNRQMTMRFRSVPALFALSVVASCGSSAPTTSDPAASDVSLPRVDEAPTTVDEPTTTQERKYDDFVFDASADITAFPPAFYQL